MDYVRHLKNGLFVCLSQAILYDPLDIYLQECFGKGQAGLFEDMKGALQDFIEGRSTFHLA